MAVSKAGFHREIEQLADLHEASEAENERLRRALEASDAENAELREHLDAQEQRLTQLEALSERLGGSGNAPAGNGADDDRIVRLERELERREEVIEVLQEALRTHEALREDLDSEDDDIDENDAVALRRRLVAARHKIRALANDLRVRGDVIDALESDAVALQIAEARLEESKSHNDFLRNELGLALGEIARLRKREKNSGNAPPQAHAERASDVAALLVKLEESEARNRSLEATVAALERLLSADDMVLTEEVVLSEHGDRTGTDARR